MKRFAILGAVAMIGLVPNIASAGSRFSFGLNLGLPGLRLGFNDFGRRGRDRFNIGIGIPFGFYGSSYYSPYYSAPAYCPPTTYYVAPPVVYSPPPVVYYTAPQATYAPAPVYVPAPSTTYIAPRTANPAPVVIAPSNPPATSYYYYTGSTTYSAAPPANNGSVTYGYYGH